MKYNTGDFIPPEKKSRFRIFLVVSCFVILVIAIIIFLIFLPAINDNDFSLELVISAFALVVSLGTILFSVIEKISHNYHSTKKTIDLTVETNGEIAIFTTSIANVSHKRIQHKNVYLFVSGGKFLNGEWTFNLPIQHESDEGKLDYKEEFCIYSKLLHLCDLEKCCVCCENKDFIKLSTMQSERLQRLAKRYNEAIEKEIYHRTFIYSGLARASRVFLDPGEEFSDEIVLTLPHGIYRAVSIWIPDGEEDCACAVKYFSI